ncbi:MAG: PQQ-dependent sugar dehydrogenase [Pyrinomonadaceae bacterium]
MSGILFCRAAAVSVLVFVAASLAAAQTRLVPQRIELKNKKSFTLNVAEGFEVIPAAEGLRRVRFFAKAPDGRIFVTDMHDLTDNRRGAIYILDEWDADAGKFGKVIPYMTGLHNPNSVQFYRDASGQHWIYIAETEKLTRRRFTLGETRPTDASPQTLATFPDYGLSYKYGGWHLTRTIAFGPGGKLYVSVGSSCNACVEKEEVRATVIEMNADGTAQRIIARGLRNAVGLKWIGSVLFATNQGSDHLGLQRPDETFYALKRNTADGVGPEVVGAPRPKSPPAYADGSDLVDYGWPYCHSSNGRVVADPKFKRAGGCRGVPPPYAYFPARSSALGFDRFGDDSPDAIRNAFLVSLHGSTNKAIGRGYKIVAMRKGERLRDLITGFLQRGVVMGRPCDIIKLDANSFLFTDDNKGVVYFVRRKV